MRGPRFCPNEIGGPLKSAVTDVRLIGMQTFHRPADQAALHPDRLFRQHTGVKSNKVRIFLAGTFLPDFVQQAGEDLVIAGQRPGSAPEHFPKAGIVGFEGRDQQMAQTVAKEIQRGIAWVVPGTKSVRGAIYDRLLAPRVQQGTDNGDLRVEHLDDRAVAHPLQPRQPGAADEVHQDGLDLVIGGVSHGHRLGMELAGLLHQKSIAQDAGRLLDRKFAGIGKGAHIPALDHRGQVEARRGLLHDIGIRVRVRPQLVVEVRHNDAVACLAQDAHQTQAVRSAGDPGDDRKIAVQPALFGEDRVDVFEHGLTSVVASEAKQSPRDGVSLLFSQEIASSRSTLLAMT